MLVSQRLLCLSTQDRWMRVSGSVFTEVAVHASMCSWPHVRFVFSCSWFVFMFVCFHVHAMFFMCACHGGFHARMPCIKGFHACVPRGFPCAHATCSHVHCMTRHALISCFGRSRVHGTVCLRASPRVSVSTSGGNNRLLLVTRSCW